MWPDQKIKKTGDTLQLNLIKTKDILKQIGSERKPNQYIAGFALETENEISNAVKKLQDKNVDCIILNSMNDLGAGFEKETNKISIINKNETISFEVKSKKEVAEDIVKFISEQINK